MGNGEEGGALHIGSALKEARRRAGLDIRTVEDRTKIRIRYLRALENEEWGTLPGHAYVKGFLRTYGRLLGLDDDALVAEYRRTVEGPRASPVPLGEGVLQARRPGEPAEPRNAPRRGLVVGGAIVAVVGILLVLGLTGGEDGEDQRKPVSERAMRGRGGGDGDGGRGGQADRERKQEDKRNKKAPAQTVTLELVANTDGLQVCLLGDGNQPLIDGQMGSAGSKDSFEAKKFRLRFPFGYDRDQFNLRVGGKREQLPELSGPAAFVITPPRQVRRVDSPQTSCP